MRPPRDYVAELKAKLAAPDTRPRSLAFHSANCTYWNDMRSFGEQMHAPATPEMPYAGRVAPEIPRCPFCGSPGFEAPFSDFVAAFEAQPDQLEVAAWRWQQGRQCHPTREAMVAAYWAEIEAGKAET